MIPDFLHFFSGRGGRRTHFFPHLDRGAIHAEPGRSKSSTARRNRPAATTGRLPLVRRRGSSRPRWRHDRGLPRVRSRGVGRRLAGWTLAPCLLQRAMLSPDPAPSASPVADAPGSPGTAFVAPDPAELAPHFPQLEILDLLGQGGMGAVYKARQLNSTVLSPSKSCRRSGAATRFRRAVRARSPRPGQAQSSAHRRRP